MLFTDQNEFMDIDVNNVGFANFTKIFTDTSVMNDYWPALRRTLQFAALNYLMVFVFGLSLALLVYQVGIKGNFFSVVYLPWMLSGLAVGFMALMLFARSTGTVNLLLMDWGWISKPIDIKLPQGTTVILPIVVGWKSAGFNMAIFLSGLLGIPEETIEAATVDGANYIQRLFRVIFPQMKSSFILVTIFALLEAFNTFDVLVPLGGLYQNEAAEFLSVIFFNYGFGGDKLALAMTMAVETFLPIVFIAFVLQRIQSRMNRSGA
jgi:ABC-type sugar transport system permease subunit